MSNEVRAGSAYIEIFTKDGKLNAGLKSAQEKLRNFGNSIQVVGGDMIRFGSMLSVPFFLAGKSFADFDDQMRAVKAISGANEQQLAALTDKARQLGATTAFTAQQVAEGETNLSRMGFSAEEAVQSIEHMLYLTRATGTETFRLAEVSTYAANAMRIFKIDTSQAADVADVMAYAANQSAQDIFDFGEAIKIAGPSAQAMGEDLRDASAMTMVLAEAGVRGSLAGTALRKVYQSLAAQTGNWTEEGAAAATQLQEMGIQLTDSNGNMRKAADIMFDLADVAKRMKTGEKINFTTDVFDLRGSLGALSMLSNPEKLKGFRQALDNVSGLAKKTADEMESGPGGTFRRFWSQLSDLGIEAGKQLAVAFVPFLNTLTVCLKGITNFVKEHGKLVAVLGGSVAVIAAAGLTLISFGLACKIAAVGIGVFRGAVLLLIATKTAFVASLSVMKGAMIALSVASPFGWAVAATAVIGGLILLYRKFTRETQKATNSVAELTSKHDLERKQDLDKLKRIDVLSKKRKLSNDETEEAGWLIDDLNDKYGNLGIKLNTATGAIDGMSGAVDRLIESMKKQTILDIDKDIATRENNIKNAEKINNKLSDGSFSAYWNEVSTNLATGFGLLGDTVVEQIENNGRYSQAQSDEIKKLKQRKQDILNGDKKAITGNDVTGGRQENQIELIQQQKNRLDEQIYSNMHRRNEKYQEQKEQKIINSEHSISYLQQMMVYYGQIAQKSYGQYQTEITGAYQDGEITTERQKALNALYKSFEYAAEKLDKYRERFEDAKQGTNQASSNINAVGSWSTKALAAMIGGGDNVQKRIAIATEALVNKSNEGNRYLKTISTNELVYGG